MKRTAGGMIGAVLVLFVCATAAAEPGLSDASAASALASTRVPKAAIEVLAASGRLAVVSVEASGQSAKVVLRGASDAARFSLTISIRALQAAGIVAGSIVYVSTVTGGFIVSAGAEVLAFVPDALSQSMIHQRRLAR